MLFGKKTEKNPVQTEPSRPGAMEADAGLDMPNESLSQDSVRVQRGVAVGYEEETVRPAAPGRAKVMAITIKDRKTLHAAYMPFVESGGIFVPSTSHYNIGDEVFLLLKLIDSPDQISISGQVVWITPTGAQGNRQAGIGVQFTGPDANHVRTRIEGLLGGALKSRRTTHTM